jgi:hypothetical protein
MADQVTPAAETSKAVETVAAAAAAAQTAEVKSSVADATKETESSDEQSTLLGQGGEAKKEETAKVVPEKYELKPPEGMNLDEKAVELFAPVFKEIGLSQDQAQKLVDTYGPYFQQQLEAQRTESLKGFKDMVSEWGEQSKKELGADYAKKLSVVSKVIDKSGVKGIRELMNETGIGNNPTMIKFMLWVGEQFSQDTLADSQNKRTDSSPEALAKKMYPTMQQ